MTVDRHMRDSLDRWLTTPPEERCPDPNELELNEEPECTVDYPHTAAECDGIHYDLNDL